MSAPPRNPRQGWHGLRTDLAAVLREQLEFRDLLLALTRRDLLLRYEHSALGFGWAVCMPLLSVVVFSLIFTRVAPISTGIPYPLYAFAGLLPWNWFASALRTATTSLTSNPNLVTKIYFPREVFPFSMVLVALVDFLVAGVVLIAMMVYYGVEFRWTLVLLPVVVLVQLAFTAGVALAAAMANLFYRDVKHLTEVVLMVWMFATSVLYPVDRVGGVLGQVLQMNPMTPIVDAYRALLLEGTIPDASLGWAALASALTLSVSWLLFHRSEHRFAEEI